MQKLNRKQSQWLCANNQDQSPSIHNKNDETTGTVLYLVIMSQSKRATFEETNNNNKK